jgi:hypothetical protein
MRFFFSRPVKALSVRLTVILATLFLGALGLSQNSVAQPAADNSLYTVADISLQKVAPLTFENWVPVIKWRREESKKIRYNLPKFNQKSGFNGTYLNRGANSMALSNGPYALQQTERFSTINATTHISFEPFWDVVVMPGADIELVENGIVVHTGHIVVRGTRTSVKEHLQPTITITSGDIFLPGRRDDRNTRGVGFSG